LNIYYAFNSVKNISQIAIAIALFGLVNTIPSQAAPSPTSFTSFYVFGDGTSTTTNNPYAGPSYYGQRYCNGRVWVEVLAQRLGLGANSVTNVNWYDANNDWSYYGQYSPTLVVNINSFVPPPDVKTALFAVWVSDADFVNDMATIYSPNYSTNADAWNTAISQSLNNLSTAINNLYAKGVRTLVMPDAVDITEVPQYNGLSKSRPADRAFIRQEIINFNAQFTALVNQKRASTSLQGLTIYEPDFFGLLDNILTNATAYGLTNAQYNGVNNYALAVYGPSDPMNGPGENFIFWDQLDPSAKVQEIMGDTAEQLVAPVGINSLSVAYNNTDSLSTNKLDIVNVPVGLNGFIDGTTNIGQANTSWTTVTNFNSTSVAQSLFVVAPPLPPVTQPGGSGSISPGGGSSPANGSSGQTNQVSAGTALVYRLRFPFAWNWP
jgi:phospholipase/lecithinase/hemolysin